MFFYASSLKGEHTFGIGFPFGAADFDYTRTRPWPAAGHAQLPGTAIFEKKKNHVGCRRSGSFQTRQVSNRNPHTLAPIYPIYIIVFLGLIG
jgi:hypothetical protein